jgi:sec-independent protein translocase protein TatA
MSFGSLGLPEILLILLIVVIIFGARRLPELGKSLGEGIKNFKKSVSGKEQDQKEISSDKNQSTKKE